MQLNHGLHLAYCTNIHRGETWDEILSELKTRTLAVRDRVCAGKPYAIGLRLGITAARELSDPVCLTGFQRWLDRENCYVFTINGFPYGRFHGTRVKEQVYLPDWSSQDRLDYTVLLFEILVQLVPTGVAGSVSTVPCSYKEFVQTEAHHMQVRLNLWKCIERVAELGERSGRLLHLGLEPEPLCYIETTEETCHFYGQMREDRPGDARLDHHLGVNYDACHLACEFESAREGFRRFRAHRVPLSKIHLSSALKVRPSPEALGCLRPFVDDVYFHQVIERATDGQLRRYRDLDVALADAASRSDMGGVEWRIHFHVPLHAQPDPPLETTVDHLVDTLDLIADNPVLCQHLEMETYTWEVLPSALKTGDVTDQLVREYEWTLARLRERGLAPR